MTSKTPLPTWVRASLLRVALLCNTGMLLASFDAKLYRYMLDRDFAHMFPDAYFNTTWAEVAHQILEHSYDAGIGPEEAAPVAE